MIRRLGRGGGTTVPGRLTAWIEPAALARLGRGLPGGSIVVTATNGKTTTARLIAQVFGAAGRRIVHNRSGANLLGGVTSALVRAAGPSGRTAGDVGLFEVDEASVPEVAAALEPRVLAIGNLFRDQLDRYGEVAYLAGQWRRAVERLSPDSTLVLNADDPGVSALAAAAPGRVLFVGIEDRSRAGPEPEHTADARLCPRCAGRLEYEAVFYGHLGHYRCPACAFARPRPDLAALAIEPRGFDGSLVRLRHGDDEEELLLPLPGLYNVYNALLALGAAAASGVELGAAARAIERSGGAFGRIERIPVRDRTVLMALVKNPVGFDQVLRTVLDAAERPDLLIAINDLLADGTDVSWLWDVEFEALVGRAGSITLSGTRAGDMGVRLKYAGVDPAFVRVEATRARALDVALEQVESGGTLYVLPTYTAMLELRGALARRGHVPPFWED
ncbi:MAG TPA: MurT ligase domain-containing protein [Chloroflexota bacterium]